MDHQSGSIISLVNRKIQNGETSGQKAQVTYPALSPPQRLLFFKKPRQRGKGGKKGKAEKRERRKKRERKGKAKKASARFLSKYGARPGGGCALQCLHAGLWNKEF